MKETIGVETPHNIERISLSAKLCACITLPSGRFMWGLLLIVIVVTGENKVKSYSVQLKFSWVSKFGVEFDNIYFYRGPKWNEGCGKEAP